MHHARHIGGPILIGLGVGIDYSLFILTRTRTGLRRGLSVEEAVTAAAGAAGRDVLFADITVCIALLGIPLLGSAPLSSPAIGGLDRRRARRAQPY
ncbi:MAG TPA: MMPL family transporter [Streptosporangiaceae bacterium]|nr:MMPL family transporter [Streptosporangiaceae bacterium]